MPLGFPKQEKGKLKRRLRTSEEDCHRRVAYLKKLGVPLWLPSVWWKVASLQEPCRFSRNFTSLPPLGVTWHRRGVNQLLRRIITPFCVKLLVWDKTSYTLIGHTHWVYIPDFLGFFEEPDPWDIHKSYKTTNSRLVKLETTGPLSVEYSQLHW
jgi:hypothetical protein